MQITQETELVTVRNSHNEAVSSLGKRHFQSKSVTEVKDIEPIEWLISDVLPAGALSMIYGDYGIGKSFLLLDWALCIATGNRWGVHDCKKGQVYYIAGEGFGGIGLRIKAWEKHYGTTVNEGLRILGEGMNLSQNLAKVCKDIDRSSFIPTFIVIDTLARCMLGGDENSVQDVGKFIDAADELRHKYRSHVAIVHHKPKRGYGPRGHTALPAAVDTMIRLDTVSGKNNVRLTCEKQKDDELFTAIPLTLQQVELHEKAISGKKATSCILVANDTLIDNMYSSPKEKKKLTNKQELYASK